MTEPFSSSLPSANLPDYAELHCLSNFSFLRGASHAEELVAQASLLGYRGLAITDECSFAGSVRAHLAWRALPDHERAGLRLIHGIEIRLMEGETLVLLATDREAYGHLTALVTLGRRRAEKGRYCLYRNDLGGLRLPGAEALPGCLVLWCPRGDARQLAAAAGKPPGQGARGALGALNEAGGASTAIAAEVSAAGASATTMAAWLADAFPGRAWIAYERHLLPDDQDRLAALQALGAAHGLPLVAAGDVHMHLRQRRPLQDLMTALRLNQPLHQLGTALFPNGERHLRHRLALGRLYPPALLAETLAIADRCRFTLDELRYEYPDEVVPAGMTPAAYLRQETFAGLDRRYPDGVPEAVRAQVEAELALIGELAYEAYFLTVYDIVLFARQQGILCQGRGSAANSAVCFALGITEADPARSKLLFGRFLSRERNEPPDIDVDFEHQRREEVIQYLYRKYGRERAALVATVITYRSRSALRDVGRALGVDQDRIDALTASLAWWDRKEQWAERFAAVGLSPQSPVVQQWMALARELSGFPRHLSQHVGGFVIARGRLDRLVPVENAAMPERSVIQWDKDDIDTLGLLKVDVLSLGMLSAIRRTLACLSQRRGRPFTLQDIPAEDPATYRMIQRADTVGVFQIESRAQMTMLPRLKPRCFYDLVIEVAIVRPGPIQGDMVHPYLRRRQGLEPVTYPTAAVRDVLERTLGVPIFQEQAMQLSMVAAGFTPGEADQLRRAMAAWKRKGGLGPFKEKLLKGMAERGYSTEFAEALYRQLQGFGDYGFPESHAISFALLAYVSAWLKCHAPAEFLVGLLNALPMGFYSASQLVQDARRHGVEVLPPDVTRSEVETTLEGPAVRLGLHRVKGLSRAAAERIPSARQQAPFRDLADLAQRARLTRGDLTHLAAADTLQALAGHRRQAAWASATVPVQADLLLGLPPRESPTVLPAPTEGQNLMADYAHLGLSLGRHPLALLRPHLDKRYTPAAELAAGEHRRPARCVGIVTNRQRPGGAAGVIFVTLEDETGTANVIVHGALAERQRKELLGGRLLGVLGILQKEGPVIHLIAKRLLDHTPLLGRLPTSSRDFH